MENKDRTRDGETIAKPTETIAETRKQLGTQH